MGISLTVLEVADTDLARFQTDIAALNGLLTGGSKTPSCALHDYWRHLHAILIQDQPAPALPLAALKQGEVHYPKALETTHALFSGMVRELDHALDAIVEPEVRRYVEAKRDEAARKYTGIENAARWIPTPALMQQ